MSAVLTLVVPCYNEAQRLPLDDFAQFLKAHPQVRICFVDDGSRDGTRGILEEFSARFPRVAEVIALPQNKGKAEAVRAGMLRFLETPHGGEYAGFWDADLATPLETSLRFLDVLEKDERTRCVIGSRSPKLGAKVERKPLRHFVGNAVAFVIRRYLGVPIYDTQCGAKIFCRAEVAELFNEPFVSRWLFDVEIFKRMTLCHSKAYPAEHVREMPLLEWRDVAGSKLKFYHGAKIMLELARIALHYRGGFLRENGHSCPLNSTKIATDRNVRSPLKKVVETEACSCDNVSSHENPHR